MVASSRSSASPSPVSDKGIQPAQDVINRGGVQIAPASIEDILAKHAHVEAQVIGLSCPQLGEEPYAVIRCLEAPFNSTLRLRNMITNELGEAYDLGAVFTLGQLGLEDFPSGPDAKAHLRAAVRGYLLRSPEPTLGSGRTSYF